MRLLPNAGNVIVSSAGRSFDSSGNSSIPLTFRRELFQTYTEYGWRPNVTLILESETANVAVAQSGVAPFHGIDNEFGAGVRLRIDPWLHWKDSGVLSVELSLRTAGAFNFAISANNRTGGSSGQLRLLYGRSFKLRGRDAFVDIEAGEEFMAGIRPNETPLDITFGVWLGTSNMLMAQSFNLFGAKGSIAAYPAFDSHKIQLSWVHRFSAHYLLQASAFASPFGSNALVEQGVGLALWKRF